MSSEARIYQVPGGRRDFDVLDYTLIKNGNPVTATGQFRIAYLGGMGLISARLVITSTPDGTGNWSLSVPDLLYADQVFGFWNTSTISTAAKLSTAVVTPLAQPSMSNGSYFTILGTVS